MRPVNRNISGFSVPFHYSFDLCIVTVRTTTVFEIKTTSSGVISKIHYVDRIKFIQNNIVLELAIIY